MDGIHYVSTWHFLRQGRLKPDVQAQLMPNEQVYAVYQTIRDQAVFTNLRLIVRDAQGITGQKVETFSLPWKSVQMWSTENSGKIIDVDSELELWTLIGTFKINLKRGIDIRQIDRLVMSCVMIYK